jgi:hypothetical protein
MPTSRRKHPLPPGPRADAANTSRTVKRNVLISILNKLCFYRYPVTFVFQGVDNGGRIGCQAIPEPCVDDQLTCLWSEDEPDIERLTAYVLEALHIEDDGKLVVVVPELKRLDGRRIVVSLPENGRVIDSRKAVRHAGNRAAVCVQDGDVIIQGELLDFHAGAFSVAIDDGLFPQRSHPRIDSAVKATITRQRIEVYSGDCIVVRQSSHEGRSIVVLSPILTNIPVQKPKKYRCERVKPTPSPYIAFRHSLTQEMVILDVAEISGSGFSVIEDERNPVLLPGMVIPSMELRFFNLYRIECSAKVIHCQPLDDKEKRIGTHICGLVFTDMDMADHTKLASYLHQAKDQRALICHPPDMNALWNFFFETGFIYPEKYKHLYSNRDLIRKNLQKIYLDHPSTSRHFILHDKGVIKGLIALQRVYRMTWMMHHFAARKDAVIAGPKVLSLIGSYINDSYNLEANRMKYAIIYYREENKFPNLVFGGVARSVKNPRICSLDTFAYFHIDAGSDIPPKPEPPWCLASATAQDLVALKAFYLTLSGGLMLDAFDLLPDSADDSELKTAYEESGLTRERHLLSLRHMDSPQAVIMVQVADMGLNLSDLTNCIHVFLINSENIDKETMTSALSHLAYKFYQGVAVVNFFPSSYSEVLGFESEKQYTLWTYEMQYSDYYYEHLKKLSRLLSIRE